MLMYLRTEVNRDRGTGGASKSAGKLVVME